MMALQMAVKNFLNQVVFAVFTNLAIKGEELHVTEQSWRQKVILSLAAMQLMSYR